MSGHDRRINIAVKGMHCAACSSRIEKVVPAMPGVSSVAVNLAAETMELVWDESSLAFPTVSEQVKDLGFELAEPAADEEITQTFSISGMHCASCSTRIENVVGKLPGVRAAEVNLATETARIVFQKNQCSLRKIRETIADLGFEARVTSQPHQRVCRKAGRKNSSSSPP